MYDILVELGAHDVPEWHIFNAALDTPYGKLYVMILVDTFVTVFQRFEEPARAMRCLREVSHTGKWNFHFDQRPDMNEILRYRTCMHSLFTDVQLTDIHAERYVVDFTKLRRGSMPRVQNSYPSVDHSLLSPSGRISKRQLKLAQEKTRQELFGEGLVFPTTEQPPEIEYLLKQARELRDLADRGMKVRAYRKKADELEQQARELMGQQ